MNSTTRIFFRFIDMGCILVALSISSWLMLPPTLEIFADYTGASTFTVVLFLLSFYTLDCYAVGREDFRDSVIRVVLAVIIGSIGTGFLFYTFENWRFPRLMFVLQMAISLSLCLGWRYAFFVWSRTRYHKPFGVVIFLGAHMAERARHVLAEYRPDTVIAGYVGEADAQGAEAAADGGTGSPTGAGAYLGAAQDILQLVQVHHATEVLVLDRKYLDTHVVQALLATKLNGLKVEDMRSLYERLAARVPVDLIDDDWLVLADGFNMHANDGLRRAKRAFDVCCALALLTLTAPLLLLVGMLVRLESPGRIVYSQQRVGLHGHVFTVYKIRSMRQDAEKDGPVWAAANDSRVTKIGRFIRKTRIDELPQLINVLRGDMSMIGPRPERPDFVARLEQQLPYYQIRHSVKPGITGWAQVLYPYGASLEDSRHKLEYDLYYIKNLSVLLEAKIILRTIGVVLFPKGAR